MRALEEAANRGLDVRVMLEPNPIGGGTSPSKTLDTLAASGVKTQFTNPSFSLTHEKGIPIVRKVSLLSFHQVCHTLLLFARLQDSCVYR